MIFSAALTSCEKDDKDKSDGKAVYATGYFTSNNVSGAKILKNGEVYAVHSSVSFGMSVFVSGDVSYIVGYRRTSTADNAMLWKYDNVNMANIGQTRVLSNNYSEARSVFVSGDDIYIAGYEKQTVSGVSKDVAILWKNNNAQSLVTGQWTDGMALSVFVSDGDVYVAGYQGSVAPGVRPENIATLWKNGEAQNLTDGTKSARANSVYVVGDNVYVAGYESNAQNLGVAKLWKNGVEQILASPATANSVFVSGNDVYVAGSDGGAPTLWKNGVAQKLAEWGDAYSVYVDGNDVYVGGNVRHGTYELEAMIWKNGEAYQHPLDNGNSKQSSIRSVFVK